MSITMGMQYTIDLDAPLYKMPARTLLVEGDKLANALVVEVVRGKEPVDLAGLGVTGEMIRTGEVMPLTGSISGNTATLTLPQACYAVPGGFELQMRLVNTADGITRTILILTGKIERKGSGTIIDVGEVVPNLDDLLAQIDAMKQATAAAQNVVSQYDSKVAEQDGKISQLSEELQGFADSLTAQQLLQDDTIPNTTQQYTYDASGTLTAIQHMQDGAAVRTDAFAFGDAEIVETRTLATGETLTITTNLDTLETTVEYAA